MANEPQVQPTDNARAPHLRAGNDDPGANFAPDPVYDQPSRVGGPPPQYTQQQAPQLPPQPQQQFQQQPIQQPQPAPQTVPMQGSQPQPEGPQRTFDQMFGGFGAGAPIEQAAGTPPNAPTGQPPVQPQQPTGQPPLPQRDFTGLDPQVADYVRQMEQRTAAAEAAARTNGAAFGQAPVPGVNAPVNPNATVPVGDGQQGQPPVVQGPTPPTKPVKPEGYDPEVAQLDPQSASAKYQRDVLTFNEQFADYLTERDAHQRQLQQETQERQDRIQRYTEARGNARRKLVYEYGVQGPEADGVLDFVSDPSMLNHPVVAVAAFRAAQAAAAQMQQQQFAQQQQVPQQVPQQQAPNGYQPAPQQVPQQVQGVPLPQGYQVPQYGQQPTQAQRVQQQLQQQRQQFAPSAVMAPNQAGGAPNPAAHIAASVDRFNQAAQLFDTNQLAGPGYQRQ